MAPARPLPTVGHPSPPPQDATPVASRPAPAAGAGPAAAPTDLIRLDRPFDLDEFSQMLGETSIRVNVPRDDLLEVLRRVTDFMGFGIYVYSITVRPAPSLLLKEFEVELQRVDFSSEKSRWDPFVERDSPP